MRVEYINPFVETAYSILKEVLGGEVERGSLYLKSTSQPVMGVAALHHRVGGRWCKSRL